MKKKMLRNLFISILFSSFMVLYPLGLASSFGISIDSGFFVIPILLGILLFFSLSCEVK